MELGDVDGWITYLGNNDMSHDVKASQWGT